MQYVQFLIVFCANPIYNDDNLAIIVTGGSPGRVSGALTSVEVLHSDGSPWCSLPDLPEARFGHTQTGLEACGGSDSSGMTETTCVTLSGGNWSLSHQLAEGKRSHSSWASPIGTILMGFWSNGTLLDENTRDSVVIFPLKYDTK